MGGKLIKKGEYGYVRTSKHAGRFFRVAVLRRKRGGNRKPKSQEKKVLREWVK